MKSDSPVHKLNIANTLCVRNGKKQGRTGTRETETTREGIGFTKAGTAQSAGRQIEARARMTIKTRPPEGPRSDRLDRKRGARLPANRNFSLRCPDSGMFGTTRTRGGHSEARGGFNEPARGGRGLRLFARRQRTVIAVRHTFTLLFDGREM